MPAKTTEPFAASIEVEGKTYWYFRAYVNKTQLEKSAKTFRDRGYGTHIVTRASVNALYTYPNVRWASS